MAYVNLLKISDTAILACSNMEPCIKASRNSCAAISADMRTCSKRAVRYAERNPRKASGQHCRASPSGGAGNVHGGIPAGGQAHAGSTDGGTAQAVKAKRLGLNGLEAFGFCCMQNFTTGCGGFCEASTTTTGGDFGDLPLQPTAQPGAVPSPAK